MKDEEILTKAIKKAEKNGYKLSKMAKWLVEIWIPNVILRGLKLEERDYYCTIFSRDFAKAFFGTKQMCEPQKLDFGGEHDDCQEPKWKYHIKKMILSKNRIKYLEKFL